MPREEVLRALLKKDVRLHPNTLLLKKYLLTVYHGWFRINGLPPDASIRLYDYLLDDERVIIDFSRMSEASREKFLRWFLMPHRDYARMAPLSGVATNNYRGYTAEVGLSGWGRITNLLYYRKKSYHWSLAPLELSLHYQLTGLEICQDSLGLLIGLNQLSTEGTGLKYHEPSDNQYTLLRNTKRVLLTDEMVDQLVSCSLDDIHFEDIIHHPHPFSTKVVSYSQRIKDMLEYRITQRLFNAKPWYVRVFDWIGRCFRKNKHQVQSEGVHETTDQRLIFEANGVEVYAQQGGQIFVSEKCPELDSLVFCGGGAKIFAHVGALRAFEEAGILLKHFSGSSAGAIMALLSYLGCSSSEILSFFQSFKQDNLIHYEIDTSGLSDPRAMKAALDYMVIKKVNAIMSRYNIDKTEAGRLFLLTRVLRHGKITFESLKCLKDRYPDCGLGDTLIVTATNMDQGRIRYFSYETTPQMEPSEAVQASACFPVIFKPTLVEGAPHRDGGILSNFPTEVFRGDLSTLLESEHGNCLSLVAFQFDHGYERGLLDRWVKRVYRENFILNRILEVLTGVNDPVSGWEQDRLKLLQHSNQVVLIPVGNVSSTQFNIEMASQEMLLRNGYEAAKNYMTPRYGQGKLQKRSEYMYSTFTSIDELLFFCCYRGHLDWFNRVAEYAAREGMETEKIAALRQRYFSSTHFKMHPIASSPRLAFDLLGRLTTIPEKHWVLRTMQLFTHVYPLYHKVPIWFFTLNDDVKLFKTARHGVSAKQPLAGLRYLRGIKGELHILMYVFIQLLNQAHRVNIDEVLDGLNALGACFEHQEPLKNHSFFDQWSLSKKEWEPLLLLMSQQRWRDVSELCAARKHAQNVVSLLDDCKTSTTRYHQY